MRVVFVWNMNQNKGNFSPEILKDINKLKEELSLSDTDTLNWKAFLAATMDKSLVLREDKIRYAFDQFRHSDADYLTLGDFKEIFETEQQAREVFDFLDTDKNGQVSFEDFRTGFEQNIHVDCDEAAALEA